MRKVPEAFLDSSINSPIAQVTGTFGYESLMGDLSHLHVLKPVSIPLLTLIEQ